MDLASLNERWRVTGRTHAIPTDQPQDLWCWHCPTCRETGVAHVPLVGAMSEALGHHHKHHLD